MFCRHYSPLFFPCAMAFYAAFLMACLPFGDKSKLHGREILLAWWIECLGRVVLVVTIASGSCLFWTI